jgi:hypothetical protein
MQKNDKKTCENEEKPFTLQRQNIINALKPTAYCKTLLQNHTLRRNE